MKIKKSLLLLIKRANSFGLREEDSNNAMVCITAGKLQLAFDTIVTQLYEDDVKIDLATKELIFQIGSDLCTPIDQYAFTNELIK